MDFLLSWQLCGPISFAFKKLSFINSQLKIPPNLVRILTLSSALCSHVTTLEMRRTVSVLREMMVN